MPPRQERRTYWSLRLMKAKLSLRRRCFGMTPNDVVLKKLIWRRIRSTNTTLQTISANPLAFNKGLVPVLQACLVGLMRRFRNLVKAPPGLNQDLEQITRRCRCIDSFSKEEVNILFRFDSKAQLHRLFAGFRFPLVFTASSRHSFTGEEVLLVSFAG